MSSSLPHYIIDGYNLLHAVPSLKKALLRDPTGAREQLILLVSRQTFKRKFRSTIVFDGVKPAGEQASHTHSPVHVVFSSPLSADTYIRQMIEKSKRRMEMVIISSDHEILNHARACSCATHTSKYFSGLLFQEEDRGEEKEQTPLSKAEVAEWLKIFGKG